MEQSPSPDDALTGSLCLTLLDRRSSAALGGARTTCVWRDNRMTRFDADRFGRFTARMPQGAYDLVISARGYLSLFVRGVGVLAGHDQVLTRALVPGEGDDPDGEQATALGGYVTDRFGHGVGNVTIRATADKRNDVYTTRTDRGGAYLINGIVPQMYNVTVSAGERRLFDKFVPIRDAKEFVRLDLRLVQA